MERPCQAGTEGAGADAGSNPEITIVTFTQVHTHPLLDLNGVEFRTQRAWKERTTPSTNGTRAV